MVWGESSCGHLFIQVWRGYIRVGSVVLKFVMCRALSDFASSIYSVVQIIMGLIGLVIGHNQPSLTEPKGWGQSEATLAIGSSEPPCWTRWGRSWETGWVQALGFSDMVAKFSASGGCEVEEAEGRRMGSLARSQISHGHSPCPNGVGRSTYLPRLPTSSSVPADHTHAQYHVHSERHALRSAWRRISVALTSRSLPPGKQVYNIRRKANWTDQIFLSSCSLKHTPALLPCPWP